VYRFYSGSLIIPSTFGGYPVTSIAGYTFSGCSFLTSVTIPDSVTTTGRLTFYDCTSLTSVTFGRGVTSIGLAPFRSCTSLTSVLFTGNAPTIGSHAFDSTPATIYYLPDTTGWSDPFECRPAVSWKTAVSTASPPRFTSGEFAFTLTGNTNLPVTVEATTNLTSGVWLPLTNANLNASGTLDFSDPASPSHPSRFYRVTFPQ